MRYCDVCVFFVGDPRNPILTYGVAEDSALEVGSVVMVPWGKKLTSGIVVEMHDRVPNFETKSVSGKLYNLNIPKHLLECAHWMSEYYYEPLQACYEAIVLAKKPITRLRKSPIKSTLLIEAPTLSAEQEHVCARISSKLNQFGNYLIQGVTGSGKTEVYLHLIEKVLAKGQQAIYLVPEIGLTPQTVERVRARVGQKVRVVTSELSAGERIELLQAIEKGDVAVVIGSRSALFTPFEKLGLIVIDESHDGSYAQDASPRYNAIKAAEFIAQAQDIPLVCGTATPTISDLYRYQEAGENRELLRMHQRIQNLDLPTVLVADMREELKKRNFTTISELLQTQIRGSLKRGEQVVLFISRRGFAQSFLCRSCGWKAECPDCHIALVYHHVFGVKRHQLACHLCNRTEDIPAACPQCQSVLVKALGSGTERVIYDVKEMFPEARLLQMDRDTTTRKGAHEELFGQFRDGLADILVGTQMVTKGWDIPKVTTVGIINADILLHRPNYDAGESAFALMTQVGGRSGRAAGREGVVVIQTYTPEHSAVTHATRHDYSAFYDQEIALRKAFYYPPICVMATLNIQGTDQEKLLKKSIDLAKKLGETIQDLSENAILKGKVELLGPAEAPNARIKELFYMQVVLKGTKSDLDAILRKVKGDFTIVIEE